MTTLAEIKAETSLAAKYALEVKWFEDRNIEWVEDSPNLMRYIERLEAALEPFKSGEWGAWKAWLVEGAPTREEGILAAKTLTKYQYGVDEALFQREREEAR